ncbi:MAG: nucleotidyl transferase AbiEii/AbiGii toxin family protein [Candidatus Aminicenantes bacterium]|nr:nucleotidyl transferase AbiEii/AbiGii toxin family protein [Candidatus Aminicenantes bacterium]
MIKNNHFSARQYVELFHLLFLAQLGQKLDKRYYALKGGCNLRFFHKSLRYSEDIDLDLQDISPEKIVAVMDAILTSQPFADILLVHGITVGKWSKPKQTDTTQRWKIALAVKDSDMTLPTKVEFSRRGMTLNTSFAAIDPLIVKFYQLTPLLLNHYDAHAAYEQKIAALLNRKETQARDVFDINQLLNSGVDPALSSRDLQERLQQAIDNILSITFPVFKSQVLTFLNPDYQRQYDSEEVWHDLLLKIVERLERQVR